VSQPRRAISVHKILSNVREGDQVKLMTNTTETTMAFADEIKRELDEMKKLGVVVPAGAYKEAEASGDEYEQGGMSVSEAADLCIELGGME
jgi:hypothetical protein